MAATQKNKKKTTNMSLILTLILTLSQPLHISYPHHIEFHIEYEKNCKKKT